MIINLLRITFAIFYMNTIHSVSSFSPISYGFCRGSHFAQMCASGDDICDGNTERKLLGITAPYNKRAAGSEDIMAQIERRKTGRAYV